MTKIYIKKSEKELEILKVIKEKDIEFPIETVEEASSAIYEVMQDESFTCEATETGGNDYFFMCTYYSDKLGKSIVWDYDYNAFYETPEELAEALAYTENEIQEFEKKLPVRL